MNKNMSRLQRNCLVTANAWLLTDTGYTIQQILTVILMFGIVTINLMFLLGLYKAKRTKGKPNKLLMALTLSDLSVGGISVGAYLSFKWLTANEFACAMLVCLWKIPLLISISVTLVFAIDRYLTIVHNISLRVVWFIIPASVVFIMFAGVEIYNNFFQDIPRKYFYKGNSFYMIFGLGLTIISTGVIMQVHLLYHVKKLTKNVRERQKTSNQSHYSKYVNRTITLILISYFSFSSIYMNIHFYITIMADDDINPKTLTILLFISYYSLSLNSFCNTCILFSRITEVKKCFTSIVRSKNNTGEEQITSSSRIT